MNMERYGLNPLRLPESATGIPARITAVHRGLFEIVCEEGVGMARLKRGAYRAPESCHPTVGDFVMIDWVKDGESRIRETLPRSTFFARRDPSSSGHAEQAVAANFDYVFIMQALDGDFNERRLERYLTLSWQSGAVPVVVLTKADCAEDVSTCIRIAESVAFGVDVRAISAKTGMGLSELDRYLEPGKTIVLLGSSGVGKSSLVNALSGDDLMAVGEVRESDGRGRHTTSHRQLTLLEGGAMLIDTPGMRELGMWNADEGLSQGFSDVEAYFGKCRFGDCRHEGEPGCAIAEAIREGELAPERWESYLKLKIETRLADDKEGFLRDKRQWEKNLSKLVRQMKQVDREAMQTGRTPMRLGRLAEQGDRASAGNEREAVRDGRPPHAHSAAKADRAARRGRPDYRHEACIESFTCSVCGSVVVPEDAGSEHRNHCPHCLSSVHVDNRPGDRASLCRGVMEPIGVWVRKNGEWAILHRCASCGKIASNRIAADDNAMLLMSIATKPLANPPFPLWDMGAATASG